MYTVLLGMCYLTEKLLYKQLKLNFEHIATFQEVLKNSVKKKKKTPKSSQCMANQYNVVK